MCFHKLLLYQIGLGSYFCLFFLWHDGHQIGEVQLLLLVSEYLFDCGARNAWLNVLGSVQAKLLLTQMGCQHRHLEVVLAVHK